MGTMVESTRRYHAAAHAMQSGVMEDHRRGSTDGSAKHLRVAVNCRAVEHTGLVRLLIAKGVLSEEEYVASIADEMAREQRRYEDLLGVGLA